RVREYADCLIEHGQDTYGNIQSPLFAEALDRKKLKLLENDALKRVAALTFEEWGIRVNDRMLIGGNPHCEDFYQVLYALSDVTGESKYRAIADRSLEWFFKHCQSSETGLLYWGEHSGWDFLADARINASKSGNMHEFYRPWVFWDRCWELAPDQCR